uniref:Uncharacterized protein n=1 Tax=Daphnia galeata TaxID=27404 RepID=A0A8J2RLH9_9CRUS|nr:unnamed protein product [Daphnia galeata]
MSKNDKSCQKVELNPTAKKFYPYVPIDERRMSVGADLGRSSNVIPTSKRPPVRICGGPSDIRRIFWMSEYDIWQTSMGLPCAMWGI